MASYTFRSIEDRRKIQSMWESGLTAKDIANEMGMSLSTAYYELKRGQDGTRLPDKRLRYDAETDRKSTRLNSSHDQSCQGITARNQGTHHPANQRRKPA